MYPGPPAGANYINTYMYAFLVWHMSDLISLNGSSLWSILQPTTRHMMFWLPFLDALLSSCLTFSQWSQPSHERNVQLISCQIFPTHVTNCLFGEGHVAWGGLLQFLSLSSTATLLNWTVVKQRFVITVGSSTSKSFCCTVMWSEHEIFILCRCG